MVRIIFILLVYSVTSCVLLDKPRLFFLQNDQNLYKNRLQSYEISSKFNIVKTLKTRGSARPQSFTEKNFPLVFKPSIVVTSNHRFAYTLNQESNGISGFEIDKQGNWNVMRGSPFFSRGVSPQSLVFLHPDILVVTNSNIASKTLELANYVTFKINQKTGVPYFIEKKEIRKYRYAQKIISSNIQAGAFFSLERSSRFFEISKADLVRKVPKSSSLLKMFYISEKGYFLNVSSIPLTTSFENSSINFEYIPIDFIAHPKKPFIYISSSMHVIPLVYFYDESGLISEVFIPSVDVEQQRNTKLLFNLHLTNKNTQFYALSVERLKKNKLNSEENNLLLFDITDVEKPFLKESFSFKKLFREENKHSLFYEFVVHPKLSKILLLQGLFLYDEVSGTFRSESTYLNFIELKDKSLVLLQKERLFNDLDVTKFTAVPAGLYFFDK